MEVSIRTEVPSGQFTPIGPISRLKRRKGGTGGEGWNGAVEGAVKLKRAVEGVGERVRGRQ